MQTQLPPLPSDWKKFSADNLAKLDAHKVACAVEFLRGFFSLNAEAATQIMLAHGEDPQCWWAQYHSFWGMNIRNLLRKYGYGEPELGCENLDDIYIGLVERALGLCQ